MSPKKYTLESFQSIQRVLPEENPVHGEYHQRAAQESPRRKEDPFTETVYRKIRQAKADDSRYAENGCIDAPQLHRMKNGFTRQVFRRKETRYPGTNRRESTIPPTSSMAPWMLVGTLVSLYFPAEMTNMPKGFLILYA